MNTFPLTIFRNAEGGAGGAPAVAPAAAAPVAPAAGQPSPQPPAAGDGSPGAAVTSPSPAAAPADYWPDGLDAKLKGTDAKTTLDNLAGALKGYRERDASRDVFEDPKQYASLEGLKGVEIDPKNKPYFELLSSDPAFGAMADVAARRGIARSDMFAVYQAGLNAMAEAGILEAPIDAKAERALLLPENAKGLAEEQQNRAIEARMTANFDFLKLAQANMGLQKDVSDYAEAMLGDGAKGHQFIEWMKSRMQAGGIGPGAHGEGKGGDTKESLRAEMAALKPNAPDYAKKHAELDERYKRLYGTGDQ
jgi:hypothetical protein